MANAQESGGDDVQLGVRDLQFIGGAVGAAKLNRSRIAMLSQLDGLPGGSDHPVQPHVVRSNRERTGRRAECYS